MSPEEFKKAMQEIREKFGGDEEAAHDKMDNLICDLLVTLGYSEGIEIFKRQDKWYA
jgi:hypothetical protein